MVGKDNAFDFSQNGFHTVTVEVTDGAGNKFSRPIVTGVTDQADTFASAVVTLPAGVFGEKLWPLDAGGFIVTWEVPTPDGLSRTVFSRHVNNDGSTVIPATGAPPAERELKTIANAARGLLGVDGRGVAAFLSIANDAAVFEATHDDRIQWIDTLTGDTVRDLTLHTHRDVTESGSGLYGLPLHTAISGEEFVNYSYDNGYVIYTHDTYSEKDDTDQQFQHFGDTRGLGIGSGFISSGSGKSHHAPAVEFRNASQGLDTKIATLREDLSATYNGGTIFLADSHFQPPLPFQESFERSVTSASAVRLDMMDIGANGDIVYGKTSTTFFETINDPNDGVRDNNDAQITRSSSTTRALVNAFGEQPLGPEPDVAFNLAVLDSTHFAYMHRLDANRAHIEAVIVDGSRKISIKPEANQVDLSIAPLGSEKYLYRYLEIAGGTTVFKGQVLDSSGTKLAGPFVIGSDTVVSRDDGTAIIYSSHASTDPNAPGVILEARSLVGGNVVVTPLAGKFNDDDNDGILDHTGTIFLGLSSGEVQSLRLENGKYGLTGSQLIVTDATVYPNIGHDITSALFKGSFTMDLASGVASNFVAGTLGASEIPLKLGGLPVTFSGLTMKKEGAALNAAFQLPSLFFADLPTINLSSPNALLIDEFGPEFQGFEVPLSPAGKKVIKLGTALDLEVTALKLRYDGASGELALGGSVKVTSPLFDGFLGNISGSVLALNGAAAEMTDLKIKDGKVDFAGSVSLKSLSLLNTVKLTDTKIGIVIDDDVVKSLDVAGAVSLNLKQALPLNGIEFAVQVLRGVDANGAPDGFTLNKIGLNALLNVPLGEGFFLDKLGGALANLAGSPPEPVNTPTSYSGVIGIGWGPKVGPITFPAALGIDQIDEARLVNIELTATTDFSTTISGLCQSALNSFQVTAPKSFQLVSPISFVFCAA